MVFYLIAISVSVSLLVGREKERESLELVRLRIMKVVTLHRRMTGIGNGHRLVIKSENQFVQQTRYSGVFFDVDPDAKLRVYSVFPRC